MGPTALNAAIKRSPKKVVQVVTLVITLLIIWAAFSKPSLRAIDPWIKMTTDVLRGETVVLGFHIKNTGRAPLTIVRGISDSSRYIAFREIWISETGGLISGPIDEVVSHWYSESRQSEPFPVLGEGYVIKPGEAIGLTYVYEVTELVNWHVTYDIERPLGKGPLGLLVRHGWTGLKKSWRIKEFERLSLTVVPQKSSWGPGD